MNSSPTVKSGRRRRVSTEQKLAILQPWQAGTPVVELCRTHSPCHRKTVYHHLKRQAWLASHRQRTQRPGRPREGKVAVLPSNQRWACDITTFKLWPGQKLRLAVIIACADRRVIAGKLQARLTALEVCELLREALFHRFARQIHQAKGLEFLTDSLAASNAITARTSLWKLWPRP